MEACGGKVNTIMNDGRNEVAIPNSSAQCLLENWVEERATKDLDEEHKDRRKMLKAAHKGLLSTTDEPTDFESVMHHDYKGFPLEEQVYIGQKQFEVERALYEKIRKEIESENEWKSEPTDYRSVTKIAFHGKEAPARCPPPIRPINIVREQPISFWTEYRDRVHGTTQVKAQDTAFRKNASFSTPIGEYWDQTLPYDIENYPKM